MATLSGKRIAQLVKAGKLVIEPFDEGLVQPASYDLRLGTKILASPLGPHIPGSIVVLTDKSPKYGIQPGQMVAVLSAERLQLPLDVSARFGIRSTFARRGIIAFGGLQIDPGFKGRLVMNLQNVGPENVIIPMREPFFSVEFQRLEEPAEIAYSGSYQDQDDFPEDQYDFILSARTTSLAEIPALRHEVARLNVLIEELEERLPDVDQEFELRPAIAERLSRSASMPVSSLLGVDEMRRKLGI